MRIEALPPSLKSHVRMATGQRYTHIACWASPVLDEACKPWLGIAAVGKHGLAAGAFEWASPDKSGVELDELNVKEGMQGCEIRKGDRMQLGLENLF